ncbi:MAG TPA: alkaline phosphatase family protein [Candidatus Binatia bacterium]|nr:alkaline phosphatase family protein [Candidatus Binatia bacterium]
MTRRFGAVVAAAAVALAGAAAAQTCGTAPTPPAAWSHVVWIFMENHSYDQVIGTENAPFVDRLARECGLATNFRNVDHPSLPNYMAATSGLPHGALGRFESDCNAVKGCRSRARSIFEVAPSWGAYEEGMPRACYPVFTGPYAASHNPAAHYTHLVDGRGTCAAHDVPYRQLQQDLDAGTLPAFAFVTPDMCHSMHDCSVGVGDAWLAGAVSRLTASAAYRSGGTAIFVTWDEGEGGDGGESCARSTGDSSCHVATLVVSPSTRPGTRAGQLYSHYSLLRTTEEMLGVGPLLGRARAAKSMRKPFNL